MVKPVTRFMHVFQTMSLPMSLNVFINKESIQKVIITNERFIWVKRSVKFENISGQFSV